jgi:mRNA interferase HigB
MHVISEKPLRAFWTKHDDAEKPLRAWYKAARQDTWESFADVRARFPRADQVDKFTVFDVAGNRYRLITAIHYNRGKVYIRHVLTHRAYDLGKWKEN